jgi:hypothetical protein
MTPIQLVTLKACEDHKDAQSFLALAETRLKTIKNRDFAWWDRTLILPGEDRESETAKHLSEAHYVILLLSPNLLAAMKDRNVPRIGEIEHKLLPVMLVDVPLDGSREFHQIDRRQIYRGPSSEGCSYNSLESDRQRNRFVDGFVSSMIRRIDKEHRVLQDAASSNLSTPRGCSRPVPVMS